MYCGNTGGQIVLVGHEYVLWQHRWTDSVAATVYTLSTLLGLCGIGFLFWFGFSSVLKKKLGFGLE